jgi:hypothetical protein
MHFFKVISLGYNTFFPSFLPLFKYECQTIFLELFAPCLHSFDDLPIAVEFPAPEWILNFRE